MKAGRRDELLKGQSSLAQKVYGAVPIQEVWTIRDIMTELGRLGFEPQQRVAQGALNTLCDVGLVQCPIKDQYRRTPVREPNLTEDRKEAPMADPTPSVTPAAPAAPAPKQPIQILEVLARRTLQLSTLAKELATDIENAAIEIQHQVEISADEQKALNVLRSLLKTK